MEEGQIEIFGELVQQLPLPPTFEPTTTCAKCEHIVGVQFGNGNIFFCSIQNRHRATYGGKIKKSNPNCSQFQQATEETIQRHDGYYGGKIGSGLKR